MKPITGKIAGKIFIAEIRAMVSANIILHTHYVVMDVTQFRFRNAIFSCMKKSIEMNE